MEKSVVFGAVISALVTIQTANASGRIEPKLALGTLALPAQLDVPAGSPGKSGTWTVWTCPNAPVCRVEVKVNDSCEFVRPDFIDRNKDRSQQIIVWNIVHASGGTANFNGTSGITITLAARGEFLKDPPLDVGEDAKTHFRKLLKKRNVDSLITYDINVLVGPGKKHCSVGPAIISRG